MAKETSQYKTAAFLLVIGLLYFCAFIFPNNVGAANLDMLAVFEIDEYAQYPFLSPMLSGGATVKQALRNFLVYGHYFYGYPFYFFSAVALLPLRLLVGEGWSGQTQLSMLILRQVINVLPNMLAGFALTFFTTRFQSRWKSCALFILLLITPALVNNGLWWHPDGLGLLFVSLAFVCLLLDHMQFGRYFLICALCAGIAAGIKYLGFFFLPTIPVYLAMGIAQKKISWQKGLKKAGLFLALMVVTILVSNPLLLLPLERSELVATQLSQFSRTTGGELIGHQPFLENGSLPGWMTTQYGSLFYLLVCAGSLVYGIVSRRHRVYALLICAFILPLSVVTILASLQRTHYWLPVLLPLSASLGFTLADQPPPARPKAAPWWHALIMGIMVIQAIAYMGTNISRFAEMLQREQNSPALTFHQKIESLIDQHSPAGSSLLVYRDWKVYFPGNQRARVFMDWDLASYDLIAESRPDFLLLERVNVQTYGAEDFLARSADPVRLAPMHRLYADAFERQIQGYQLIYEDEFGLVFQKTAEIP